MVAGPRRRSGGQGSLGECLRLRAVEGQSGDAKHAGRRGGSQETSLGTRSVPDLGCFTAATSLLRGPRTFSLSSAPNSIFLSNVVIRRSAMIYVLYIVHKRRRLPGIDGSTASIVFHPFVSAVCSHLPVSLAIPLEARTASLSLVSARAVSVGGCYPREGTNVIPAGSHATAYQSV